MDQPPTVTVTKDELKVALLENNEKLVGKFNDAIEKSADKVTKAVQDQTSPFIQSFGALSEKVGEQHKEIEFLQSKMSNIWGKFIGIGAGLASLTAFVTYFLTKG